MDLIPVKGLSWEAIELDAELFLSECEPQALLAPVEVNVERIFEFKLQDFMKSHFGLSFEVGYFDLSEFGHGVQGHTNAEAKCCYIDSTLSDSADNSSTHRFFRSTIGHEIYHCIKHVPQVRGFSSTLKNERGSLYRKKSSIPVYQNPDIQADTFSGALLMPRKTLLPLLADGAQIPDLVNVYNVNPAFVNSRLRCNTIKN